jgi:NSS family neurotransmitter:Na+ symporter
LTSAISLLEVVTAYFIDEFGMSRRTAATMFGAICFLMGMGCVYGDGYLGFLDNLQGSFLLPVGALFISLFAGWKLNQQVARAEFEGHWYLVLFGAWRWCVRIAAPVLVALVILNAWGVFDRLFQDRPPAAPAPAPEPAAVETADK